jgi:hypothetical protein
MWRRGVLRSKAVLAALALLLASLCFVWTREFTGVPQAVAIRGGLSKAEAESLYTSNDRTLHTLYWRRVRANVVAGQFKEAWLNLQRGPERIHTVSKEPDGWFLVSATNRLGNSCTVRTRQLAAPPPNAVWTVKSRVVEGELVLRDRAQPGGAANRSQPVGP